MPRAGSKKRIHRRDHEPYFLAVERTPARWAGGRAGASCTTAPRTTCAPAYERFDDFVAVRDKLDPDRMFGNEYLAMVLG